uniref:Condensin-2 complex subunit G2 n=1 Tax=Magallana gigas TaxID=29159 RepID=K1PF76_MAGGI
MTTETEESHYGCLLEAKCKWNKMADLLELLQEWISAGFRGGKKESTAKKGKDKRKSVTFAEEENQYGPVLAARYLTYLITHPVCRAGVLSHHPRELIQIQEQLQKSMLHMGNRLDQTGDSLNDDLLTQYFVMYCRLTLLLQDQAQEDFDGLSALVSVMEWAEDKVLPHINSGGVEEEGKDEKFLLLSDITSCLYHVTEFVVSLEEESGEQSSVVVDLLTDVLMSAQRKSQHTTDTEKAIGANIKGPVTEILTSVYNRGGQQTMKQSLTAALITTVMDEMTQASVKDILEGVTESLDSLPPVSSLLTGVISKKPKILW